LQGRRVGGGGAASAGSEAEHRLGDAAPRGFSSGAIDDGAESHGCLELAPVFEEHQAAYRFAGTSR
jgi:hypothetical protein